MTVVCDKLANKPSGEECASTTTGGRYTTAKKVGENLELQLIVNDEKVGRYGGRGRIFLVLLWERLLQDGGL